MSWDEYFMKMAWLAASKSKDPSTKVGCVMVSPDNVVCSTGFNGLPRKVAELPDRMQRPEKYLWTCHAEENAVAQAARTGTSLLGVSAYVTHHPCPRCARALIQAGVCRVWFGHGETVGLRDEMDVARQMFWEAGVLVFPMTMEGVP